MFIVPSKNLILYKNSNVRKFITKFFDVEEGVRCRTRHHLRKKPFYGTDCEKCFNFNFVAINNKNIKSELRYGLSHFLCHIFDEEVLTEANDEVYSLMKERNIEVTDVRERRNCAREIYENHIVGITNVIDIDSPYISETTTKRRDFFDEEVIGYFNKATELISNLFDDCGEKYNCEFSGNGFYFINEPYIPDEYNSETVREYKLQMVKLIKVIDHDLYKLNVPIEIKQKSEGWNRYYKMPFAIHKSKNRIAMPLNNDNIGNIDSEWLDYASNLDNVKNDKSIIDEIINKSGW